MAAGALHRAVNSSFPLPEKQAQTIYIALLEAMTDDLSPQVRREASWEISSAIVALQGRRSRLFTDQVRRLSIPYLQKALRDADAEVRENAAGAFAALSALGSERSPGGSIESAGQKPLSP